MIERYFLDQSMRKIELENFFKKNLDRAGFTGLEIVKTPMVTRIVLNVARPGLAIGKGGQNIRALTEEVGKKFKIDNPQIEIKELGKAELNAVATVDRIKSLLERGFSWRSVSFKVVNDITRAGAMGVELVLTGVLAGKGGRKRRQRIAYGYMKKVGSYAQLVDFAKASAYSRFGAIGVRLKIIKPGTEFPDKANIKELIDKRRLAEKPVEVPAAAVEVEAPETIVEVEKKPEKKAKALKEKKPKKSVEKKEELKKAEEKIDDSKKSEEKSDEKDKGTDKKSKNPVEKKDELKKSVEKIDVLEKPESDAVELAEKPVVEIEDKVAN